MILTIEIDDTKYDELKTDFATRATHPFLPPQTVEGVVKSYIDDMYAALQRRNYEAGIPPVSRATIDMDAEKKAKIDAAITAAEKAPVVK